MNRLVPILAAALALAGCGSEPVQTTPMMPTVRLPAVPGRPAAGYFELRVSGDRGALLSVTSPQAERVEMHETMSRGSMSSMRPLARVAVRDGERILFAPGGRHLMLYGIAPNVRAGGTMTLVFHFERGEDERFAAAVFAAGD